jgi:threonine/homoserine/homoserine lactone efflux protein
MLIQGMLLGISLSFLIGPLLFAVVEAGIGQGFRAGISVAAGIWLSDVFYVGVVLWGVETISSITALPGFETWAAILGGTLLIGFGAGSFFSKKHITANTDLIASGFERRSYWHWMLRGFLINTFNPGTIFFWLGIVGAVVVPNGWNKPQTLVFFGGMLGTLVVTDTLKALAAKRIRKYLTPNHIRMTQKAIGALLMVFGLVMLGRSALAFV